MKPALIEALEKLVAWVRSDLLPLWRDQGFLGLGACVGAHLDPRGKSDSSGPILLASQAQMAYVFARADQLGWVGDCRQPVHKLLQFAGRHGVLPCRSDGYVHSLDHRLSIIDEHHYLLDHALFILASTAASAAYGDGSDIRRAYNIVDWLQLHFVHPQGGWFEDSARHPQRSSRSHFYMLLAFLYLYEITRKPRWLDAAEGLVRLYQHKLLDEKALRVYRDCGDNWAPLTADVWYPEDQFLWIYGVHKFARCAGRKLSAADHYHSVCESQAWTSSGLCLEKVDAGAEGAAATAGLAAAILAGVSLAAEGDGRAADALERQIQAFFQFCTAAGPAGVFVDRSSPAGVPETYTSATATLTLFDAARDAARWLKSSGFKSRVP